MKDLFTGIAIGMIAGAAVCGCCPKVHRMVNDVKRKVESTDCGCGCNDSGSPVSETPVRDFE